MHTKGPWHVGLGNGSSSIFAETGRMRLESGGTALYPIATVTDFEGEGESNAQLISAAPELLEASKALILALDNCPGNFNYHATAEDNMRKAIAKAEGR